MYQKKFYTLTQSILLATVLSSGLIVSTCSAKPSNTPTSLNHPY